jgi:hypothetical protein
MASIKFTRQDAILNLLENVPKRLFSLFGLFCTWDYSAPIQDTGTMFKSGRFIRWSTVFTYEGVKKEVLFQEDVNGFLSVFVSGVLVLPPLKNGRWGKEDYKNLYRSLL